MPRRGQQVVRDFCASDRELPCLGPARLQEFPSPHGCSKRRLRMLVVRHTLHGCCCSNLCVQGGAQQACFGQDVCKPFVKLFGKINRKPDHAVWVNHSGSTKNKRAITSFRISHLIHIPPFLVELNFLNTFAQSHMQKESFKKSGYPTKQIQAEPLQGRGCGWVNSTLTLFGVKVNLNCKLEERPYVLVLTDVFGRKKTYNLASQTNFLPTCCCTDCFV